MNEQGNKRIYCVDTKVETFIREWYYTDSDEDAIEMAKDGTFEYYDDAEFLWDFAEYPKKDGNYIVEVYKDTVWDKPIYSNII